MSGIFEKFPGATTSETQNQEPEKAILVSIVLDDSDLMDTDSSLDELEELLKTAGGVSLGRLIQIREKPEHAT